MAPVLTRLSSDFGFGKRTVASSAAASAYAVSRSLRFNSADSAYLSRTPASAGNRKTWTWSGWVKRSKFDATRRTLFRVNSSPETHISFAESAQGNAEALFIYGASGGPNLLTTAVFRDPSAWYHIVVVFDTAQATASNRVKIYVNGAQITTFNSSTYPDPDYLGGINTTGLHAIGASATPSEYHDGYVADIHFIDGYAYDPSYFGETNATTGVWDPKTYSGSYGTNGFHLDFADNSAATAAALGKDTSGNGNNWTPNNLSVSSVSVSYGRLATSGSDAPSSPQGTPTYTTGSTAILNASSTDGEGDFQNTRVVGFQNITGVTTLRVLRVAGSSNAKLGFNGSLATVGAFGSFSYPATIGQAAWDTISSPPSTLTSMAIAGGGSGASNQHQVYRIEVNGTVVYDVSASDNDSLIDTPTNGTQTDTGLGGEVVGNYATLNPLSKGSNITLANGNLDVSLSSTNDGCVLGTIGMSSGKWYWEIVNNTGSRFLLGIATSSINLSNNVSNDAYGWAYFSTGVKRTNNSGTSYGATYTTGDVIGVAFDADNGTLAFYKNGTPQGTAFTGLTSGPYFAAWGIDSSSPSASVNFGARAFAYAAPAGFKALCTANLPTPTIAKGSDYFDVKLYTGNGSTQTISGLNFSPDFVWFKNRSGAGWHHMLFDTIRGVGNRLNSSTTNAELYDSNTLTAFNSDGFSLSSNGQVNNNLDTFVAWAWDAGANSSKTYTVTVVSGAFYIDGKQQPTLDLEEGSTYTFDLSAASNSGHPFRLSESANGPTQYTTGVTTSGTAGNAGATLTIAVASGAPTLYYFCTNHSGMGGQINTNSTAGASNFAGSITSTVRANASAGFSIVTWTGNSSNSTVGHGLGVAPSLIIAKARNEINFWPVYHASLGRGAYLGLDETSASNTTYADYWGDANPTSTVFGIKGNAGNNRNGKLMLAYCFAPVAGYSSFGSYTGNGSTDGPFVFTGFRPRFLITKRTDSSTSGDWNIVDTARGSYNVVGPYVYANQSTAEGTASIYDLLSNGFKIRESGAGTNANGSSYIYIAFAENPFAYARAR